MTTIATLGPEGSHAFQAAQRYDADAGHQLHPQVSEVLQAFSSGAADRALIPVYNTREGEIREYFHAMERLSHGHWVDNVVLPIHLALGGLDTESVPQLVIGTGQELRHCQEFLDRHFPDTPAWRSRTWARPSTASRPKGPATGQ